MGSLTQPTDGGSPGFAPSRPKKGSLTNQTLSRRMKSYIVPEYELDGISSMNDRATTFFTLASFLIGVAISIWVSRTFCDPKTISAFADFTTVIGAPLIFLVGAVFAGMGIYEMNQAKRGIRRIKAESFDETLKQ
jgi:hypothetical protein